METEYLEEDVLLPVADDEFVVTWSVQTAEGMELWGGTFHRGPFDDLAFIRSQIVGSVPFDQVSPSTLRARFAIQLRLF